MIQYEMQPTGQLEQQLWQHSQRLDAGELFSLGTAHTFERANTIGLYQESSRIIDAEKEAGTFDPLYGVDTGIGEVYDTHRHAMQEEDWKKSEWYREKPDGKAAYDYTPDMTPQRAQILSEVYDRRQNEKQLIDISSDTYGRKALLLGAGFLASLPDPVNFVPLAGSLGKGASIAHKIGKGVIEGAVGAALTDAIVYPVANSRGEDFTFYDLAMDITFGAVIGGGIAGAVGKVSQWRDGRAHAEIDAGRQDFTYALEDLGFAREDAGRYSRQVFDVLKDMPDGLNTARQLRGSIGGEARLNAGRIMEKALLDVADGNPADVRVFREMLDAGGAFDQVGREIAESRVHTLPGDEVLARIAPEDLEALLVQRGHSIMGSNGELKVKGRELLREKGTKQNFGLVKIEVRHPEITRSDVMSLPRIVREYEPSAHGPDGRREWRIDPQDGSGKHLLIAEGRTADGQGVLASFYKYIPDEGQSNRLSQKRAQKNAPAESHPAGFQPEPGDTNGGLLGRHTRSQQGQNAPDISGTNNISTHGESVKDFSPARPEPGYRAPELPTTMADELHAQGIDPATGRSVDEVEVSRLAEEGRIAPEDMEVLQATIAEGERVNTREDIALSLVGCVMGGI